MSPDGFLGSGVAGLRSVTGQYHSTHADEVMLVIH